MAQLPPRHTIACKFKKRECTQAMHREFQCSGRAHVHHRRKRLPIVVLAHLFVSIQAEVFVVLQPFLVALSWEVAGSTHMPVDARPHVRARAQTTFCDVQRARRAFVSFLRLPPARPSGAMSGKRAECPDWALCSA